MLAGELSIAHGVAAGAFLVLEAEFFDAFQIALGPGAGPYPHGVDIAFEPGQGTGKALDIGQRRFFEITHDLRGIVHLQIDAGPDSFQLVLFDHGRYLALHLVSLAQSRMLQAGLEQGIGREDGALALDTVVIAQIFGLQGLPARIDIGGQHVMQGGAIGIFLQADDAGQQRQAAKEADTGAGARRLQVLLRLSKHAFHLLRAPLHLFRQRRIRGEYPQHMAILADLPQARTGTLRTHHDTLRFPLRFPLLHLRLLGLGRLLRPGGRRAQKHRERHCGDG
ncbi:hypothetical protein YQ44_15535 [Janthinobacterium sp. 1_2014MBL_MicDiv]|nr:hypothetical protein YQ44_15535 [Janthinobacterium sp. 1_2014MBL_MicDiv]